MKRRLISIMLVIAMVLSVVPATVFATESETEPQEINYVSLGDSMTNGYGLDGYNHNSGVEDYGYGAYPNQFANWLRASGATVDHAQLAMSGIRTEDIHWLLELDFTSEEAIAMIDKAIANLATWDNVSAEWNEYFGCGDFWTVNEICDHSRTNATYFHIVGGSYESYEGCTDHGVVPADFCDDIPDVTPGTVTMGEKVAVIAKYYQENVAAADIISLSVGNGNIGVFGFGRILEVIGFQESETYLNYNVDDLLRECEPEMKAQVQSLIAEIKTALNAKIGNEDLVNVAVYIAVSLVLNYAGTLDAILQMNPDAEIVLVPVMNTFGDSYTSVEGETTIGDLMGLVVDPINKYLAALPTYMQATGKEVYKDAKFYWANPAAVECMVDTYTDPLEKGSTVRKRFVESIVGGGEGMVWKLLSGMVVPVSLAEIEAYEALDNNGKLGYAAANAEKAMSIAMYLAFEKAIIAGKDNPVTIESVMGLSTLFESDPFGPIMSTFYAEAVIKGESAELDAISQFITDNSGGMLSADQVEAIVLGGEAAENVYYELVEAQAGLPAGSVANIVAGNEAGKAVLYALVEASAGLPAGSVANIVADNEAGKAVLYALVEANAGLPAGSVANIVADNEAGKAVLYTLVEAQAGLPAGSVAAVIAGNEQGMAVLCAIVAAKISAETGTTVTAEQVAALAAANDPTILGYIAAAKQMIIDGVATAKQTVLAGIETAKQTVLAGIETAKQTILDGIDTAKATVAGFDIPGNAATLYMLLVMPEVLSRAVADSELAGLLALFARCIIGNGIGAHPSQTGHDTLAVAVIEAYENEHTAAKETLDYVLYLIRTYYDEAYAYAYAYAKDEGYIEALVAAIDEQIAALKNLDLDEIPMTDEFRAELEVQIRETIEDLEAAKALILEADVLDQPTLDALLALLTEAGESVAHILHLLEQAGMDITELYIIPVLLPELKEKLEEAVKAGTEYLLEKLGEAYDALVEALVEHITEKAPEAADWIYNWLYNNPETVIAFFNEYGDEMIDFITEYGDEAAMVIGYILVNYGEDVLEYVLANGDEILVAITKWYAVHGENTWALVKVYLDALGITDDINGVIDEVIETLSAEVARIKAELETALNELKAMAEALKAEIETAVGEHKEELEALLAEVEAAIAKLEEMQAKLEAALENLGAALAQLEDAIAKLLTEGFHAGAPAVQAALDAVAAAVEELVALVSEEAAAEFDKIVESLKALFNDRYQQATHGEYEIKPDSYLVALGDGTAVGESYVAQLADAFTELRGYPYNYNNLAEEGLMIQNAYPVILDNVAEIAKADLVTLGFGSNGFNNFTGDYLMSILNGEAEELDWVTYVGEEGLVYVDEMKAKLYEEMQNAGISGQYMGIDVTELMVAAVEAYAYSYVAYSFNLPEVINSIHTINPEAQVIVVGMYNPLDGVVLNMNGQKLELGEYMRYLVDAANVSALTYTMVTLDAIFVDVPGVEVKNTKKEMTVVNLLTEILVNRSANLNPSAAGQSYITEQILNALTITVSGLLGDADSNGVVNTLDAMMILQYYTELISADIIDLSVCDLDGNGTVNTVDAMLILQYYVGLIEKFPVEN